MVNVTSSNSLGGNVPKLRFPDTKGKFFTEYTHNTVRGLFTRITQRNTEGITNVITNSAEHGLIPQKDFFDKDIAIDGNTENYYVIEKGDFVYNPRKSNQAPYGPFNCYNYMEKGIVSPLYTCLRPKTKEYTDFLLWYFKSPVWHSYIYHNGSQGGARHDRVGMTTELMEGIPINLPETFEQQKIVSFLDLIERKIDIQYKLVKSLKLYKRGLLAKLFPQKGAKQPKLRIAGFTGDWEQRKLAELYTKNVEKNKDLIGFDKTISVATMTYNESGNGASEESLSTYKVLRPGDIAFEGHANKEFMFGRFIANDIGIGIMSPRFSTLRPIKEMPISFWKYYIHYEPLMRTILVNSTKAGTMMNELVIPEFLNQSILVPSEGEQRRIGDYFDHLDHLIILHQRKYTIYHSFKKSLLQQMFI